MTTLPTKPISQAVRIGTALVAISAAGCLAYALSQDATPPGPSIARFTSDNRLEFPSGYREWIFLSAGHGMTYGPAADPNGPPFFDNVFVDPPAYHEFLKSGHWPDQAVFVLDIRSAATEGSINRGGQFQKDLAAIEVEVKDRRFTETGGWAYFQFGTGRNPAAQLAKTESCYGCHGANAAVEHTFVQFYPTLIPIATEHKTLKSGSGQ